MTNQSGLRRVATLKGASQISLTVKDIDETVAFYRDLLGFEMDGDWRGEGGALAEFTGDENSKGRSVVGNIGRLRLEFMDYTFLGKEEINRSAVGLNNLTFEVADIDQAYQSCLDMGLEVTHPPAAIFNVKQFFVFDPNGIMVEFLEYTDNHDGLVAGDLRGLGQLYD